jgi:hypothetical protein
MPNSRQEKQAIPWIRTAQWEDASGETAMIGQILISLHAYRIRLGVLIICCTTVFFAFILHGFASRQPSADVLFVPIPKGIAGRNTLLVPSLADIDFGTMTGSEKKEVSFWLHNPTETAVEIGNIRTSCGCFRVAVDNMILEPGEKVRASAIVDFTNDPTDAGRLRLEATGTTSSNSIIAFEINCDVRVK